MNKNYITIISKPFLKLTKNQKLNKYVTCKCVCGNIKDILLTSIKSNKTKSCGCYHKLRNQEVQITHGLTKHPLYKIWKTIKARCLRKTDNNYKRYGQRGIKICDEWLIFINFYNWAISNGWKKELSIERKNNYENYCPENCKFATRKEQNNNTRRNRKIIAFNEIKNLSQWSEDYRCKVTYHTLKRRLNLGWNHEEAITTPKLR